MSARFLLHRLLAFSLGNKVVDAKASKRKFFLSFQLLSSSKKKPQSLAKSGDFTLAMSPVSHSSEKKDDAQDDFLCGVVEGFYGRPWTTEQRKDLFAKMQVCRI